MKKYVLKKFGKEYSLYEGYLTAYILEFYGQKTVVAKIIDNKSTFKGKQGDTRLIYCGEDNCEFYETEEQCRQALVKEVKKDE